jgi:hypothetical protein
MFFGDVAEDLFEDIFERDEALQHAIFIDHESKMLVPVAKGTQLLLECRVSGTNHGSDASAGISKSFSEPCRSTMIRTRSLTCRTPTTFSGSSR